MQTQHTPRPWEYEESTPYLLSCLQGILDSLTQNATFPADIENARRLARLGIAKATGANHE